MRWCSSMEVYKITWELEGHGLKARYLSTRELAMAHAKQLRQAANLLGYESTLEVGDIEEIKVTT